jgi:hypothetical protein
MDVPGVLAAASVHARSTMKGRAALPPGYRQQLRDDADSNFGWSLGAQVESDG